MHHIGDACYPDDVKAITVRDMPADLERFVEERAKREGLSLNRTVIKMLEEAAGTQTPAKPTINHDFDEFFGMWTEEEADEFDKQLAEMRRIDLELSA